MPWDRNLGGARVQVELAEEFRSAGHRVDKFSYEDAFPRDRSMVSDCLDSLAFCRRARAFVRDRRVDYDVIDAHQGNLPYSKLDLKFTGLLAARSVGLFTHYAAFAREEAALWPGRPRGSRIGRVLRAWRDLRQAPTFARSLREANLINVCNQDEMTYVRDVLQMGHKCVVLPFGMSSARQESFRTSRGSTSERLALQTIAFIGYWAPRKGSFDWADIVRRVWAIRPKTRFLFVGTGRGPEIIRADLELGMDERVTIIPKYESLELPGLLQKATIGAFPSYIEGFPFGILELLAAGLPTITYDVPGCRELTDRISSSWKVQRGDTGEFAERLLWLLGADPVDYRVQSERCLELAEKFDWARIAQDTLVAYHGETTGDHSLSTLVGC